MMSPYFDFLKQNMLTVFVVDVGVVVAFKLKKKTRAFEIMHLSFCLSR